MLSWLTMATSYCRKRKWLCFFIAIASLTTYELYNQLRPSPFFQRRESKFQDELRTESSTSASFDRTAQNVALRMPAAEPSPVPPPQSSMEYLTRKIVRNGSFALTVKSFDHFFSELQSQTDRRGGYIAQVQANRGTGSVSAAQIVVRMPPDSVDVFMTWLRDQGSLTSEQLSNEDISEQYFDLKARLQNARRFEIRLLEMLRTQTGKLQDLVLVEEKLNQVREQIEQFEGKIRLYDNLTGLATLTLSVRVEEHYVASHPSTFAELVRSTWQRSARDVREFLQALVLLCVGIAPWTPLLWSLVVLLWLGHKKLAIGLKKKQSAQA